MVDEREGDRSQPPAETEWYLRAVFDASSRVSIIATDIDGTIVLFNKGAELLLGYRAEEVVGCTTPELFHRPEEVAARGRELTEELGAPVDGFDVFVAHAQRGLYEEREWTYLCKDGTERIVSLAVTAVRDERNELVGLLGTAVDVSERHAVERRLRSSEELFRRLFEDSGDALLLIEHGRFVDCNDVTVRMLRAASKSEVLGTHPSELSPEHQSDGSRSDEKAEEMMALAFERGTHRFEWLHRRVDGEVFPVEVLLTAVEAGNRRLLHTCWRDITDRKRAEEQLRQAQKMDAVGQLAGGVAHDFNNMLAGVIGAVDLLQEVLQGQPAMLDYVNVISSAAERAADLTRKLLAFARKGPEILAPLDFHETVNAVRQILERTIDKRIEIALDLGAARAIVRGDKGQLQNAVLNLCLNARDAMPDGGRLEVSTATIDVSAATRLVGIFVVDPGPYLRVGIRDTGSGIEPAVLPKVFEPFFTTKEPGKGTGLGLASVYSTVKSHRGAVDVDTEVGAGTTFYIYLPLCTDMEPPPVSAAPRPLPGAGTVLVVDDEPIVREVTARLLDRLGYFALLASGCDEALQMLRHHAGEIELVLLDMIMPGKSGRDCFHEVRRLHPAVKVVMASGYTRGEEVSDLIELGLSGFLRKPFRSAELAKTLARALGRRTSNE